MRRLWVLLSLSVSWLAVAPARAQDDADPVLAKLIDESLAARPELAQARGTIDALRERIPQAGALPDPMLELGIQNDGFTSIEIGTMETSWISIMLRQTFPWPGKRGLRREIASLDAARAAQDLARLRLATAADVRRGYLALILARDRLALLGELETIWKKAAEVARIRYETGDVAQSDLLRAQLELNRLKQRRWAITAEERLALQGLNRLRSHPLDDAIATTAHLRDLPLATLPDEAEALADAQRRSPELAASRVTIRQASRAVDLAGKDLYPDVTVSAAVMPRGADFPVMWAATVGVNLPIFSGSKQRRAVAESEARARVAEDGRRAIEQTLALRVAERRTALGTVLDTISLYRQGLLVQSRTAAESTIAAYQVGKGTFTAVLEANAALVADEEGYLDSLAEAQAIAIAAGEVSLAPVAPPTAPASSASMPGAATTTTMTSGAGSGM
jgi:outer membrane protein, heavy metal efflux system